MAALVCGGVDAVMDPLLNTEEQRESLIHAERQMDLRIGDLLEAAYDLAHDLYEHDYAGHHVLERLEAIIARRRTRGRRQTAKATIPTDLRWAVWERDNFTCVDCGTRRNLSIDHVIPESVGGPTEFDNLATRCSSCNSKKGATVPG